LAPESNNSFGKDFAHHLKLADVVKLSAGSLKGFTHRRSCLRPKHAMFCGGP
jgi:hypothetical protein